MLEARVRVLGENEALAFTIGADFDARPVEVLLVEVLEALKDENVRKLGLAHGWLRLMPP